MDNKKLSFWQKWLLHSVLIWGIINLTGIITYLYYTNALGITIKNYSLWDRFVNLNLHQATPLLILLVLLLVELNHYFFYKKSTWIFIAGSLGTGIAGTALLWLFNRIQHGPGYPQGSLSEPFWFIAGYAFVYPVVLEFIGKRIFKAERLYEKSQAELHALKEQIQPHFLFNTLNSIYGSALAEQATATASSIEKLSGLMRYVLNETAADFVPVQQEIVFMEEYIALQRIRLPENINRHVVTNIRYEQPSCMIAPLILLPFIENAFKYGLSINHDCYMDLQLSVSKCHLDMTIRNSIAGNQEGTGTGISNAKKRLLLLYPGKHTLKTNRNKNQYTVQLGIQLS